MSVGYVVIIICLTILISVLRVVIFISSIGKLMLHSPDFMNIWGRVKGGCYVRSIGNIKIFVPISLVLSWIFLLQVVLKNFKWVRL